MEPGNLGSCLVLVFLEVYLEHMLINLLECSNVSFFLFSFFKPGTKS